MEKRDFDFNKRIMFKGKSCYPISPYEEENSVEDKKTINQDIVIDTNDQMMKIV
jgi:hypothetical protein